MKPDKEYFPYIFWFAVGVTTFGGAISVMAMLIDPTRIDIVLTFWLSTGVASCLGYLVGKSAKENNKKTEPGTVDVSLTASAKTDSEVSKTDTENKHA